MAGLSAFDSQRATSWNTVIAETLLGSGYRDDGHERKWPGHGGFHIDKRDGAWFSFAEDKGGYSAVALVRFIRSKYDQQAAVRWIESFLGKHPGLGPSNTDVDDDDAGDARRRARAAEGRRILEAMVPIGGTPSEQYLQARSLSPPYASDLLGHIEDVRVGESALVAVMRADERVTGVQLTYLDPNGRKSLVEPVRDRFDLEPAKHAVFEIQAAKAAPPDSKFDTVVCEGLEDGLSTTKLGRNWRIVAVPGVGVIPHLKVRSGERVLIVRDGDEPGSSADKALSEGINQLILAGADVFVTDTPRGEDANAILMAHSSTVELVKLVGSARAAALSNSGEAKRLARIDDDIERDIATKATAKRLAVQVGILRKAVADERRRHRSAAAEDEPASEYAEDPPWDGKIDLNQALTIAAERVPRYVAATAAKHYATVSTVWGAATHLVRDERVAIAVIPQLGAISIGPDSGKSKLLEIVAIMAYRGRLRGSPTAATIFRKIHEDQATYFLPELHNLDPERNRDLRAILNACHRRAEAYVERIEEINGRRVAVTYKCWAALAWGAIGKLPAETLSRAILLPMQPALPEQAKTLINSAPGMDTAFKDARRHFAAWAATVRALPQVKLPEGLINRQADNWRVLFQVAALAGSEWPTRVRQAYEYLTSHEDRPPSREVRLLTSIKDVLAEVGAPADDGDKFIATPALIAALLEDEEAGWGEERYGKPITHYWLRDNLRGLLNPAGSKKKGDVRGYFASQFSDSFVRYLPLSSVSSVSSVSDDDTALKSHGFSSTDQIFASVGTAAASVSTENQVETETYDTASTDKTDKTDETDGIGSEKEKRKKPTLAASNGSERRHRRRGNGAGDAPELPNMRSKPPPLDDATIDAAIRELRYQNPNRSLAWLAKYLGFPQSRIRAVLDAEDAS